MIIDVIEGDVNVVMFDDVNVCKKEVFDLFMLEIQIFGEEVDSDLEISEEEDECFVVMLDDDNYLYEVEDLFFLDEFDDCK